MAITKIWSVKGRLDSAIRYIVNPEKVTDGWYAHLHDLEQTMDYIKDEGKTDERYYVSGINCLEDTAYKEMIQTKARFGKMDKVQCFHAIQSFADGEATPEMAHEIGVQFAQQMWGDRFEVLLATHLNTRCLHNHFVINSVSLKDGKKYYDRKKDKYRMRELSDDLCRKYSLSIIENPGARRAKHYAEWKAELDGKPTWRSVIREDVDEVISASLTFVQFIKALERRGYEVKTGVKYMAVRPPGKDRFSRLYNLGDGYSEEVIKKRILGQKVSRQPTTPRLISQKNRLRGNIKTAPRMKGLRALYFYYLYKLGKLPRRTPKHRVPFLLQEDLLKMKQLTEQVTMLTMNRIDTLEQLCTHKGRFQKIADSLTRQRKDIYNRIRRCGDEQQKEELKTQISVLTPQIKQAKKEVKMCDDIIARSVSMIEKLETVRKGEAVQRKDGELHGLQQRGRRRPNGQDDARRN